MSSFFNDLKLLHPYLNPHLSIAAGNNWDTKLVDPALSLSEWSVQAVKFLVDIGGKEIHWQPSIPRTASEPEVPDVDCFSRIIKDVRIY